MKIVKGGLVSRIINEELKDGAASVDQIVFQDVASGATVPVGAKGTMTLVEPPSKIGHYNRGDKLDYQDSNHHNDSTFNVEENIGPSKYSVKRTA